MGLIELKPEIIHNFGKQFVQKYFVSIDKKFLFLVDPINHVQIFKANNESNAQFVYELKDFYPIHTLPDAINLLEKHRIDTEHEFIINSYHYKRVNGSIDFTIQHIN